MLKRWVSFGLFVALTAAGLIFFATRSGRNDKTPPTSLANRIEQLQAAVEQEEKESEKAVADYIPTTKIRFDDLETPLDDTLHGLPGVVQVQRLVSCQQPTHRIVHLRDYHFVPKDLYALDLRTAAGRSLSDQEVDARHRELTLEVEAVQLEQIALLRCLVRHHGLRQVFAEGLTPKDMPNFREQISALRDFEQKDAPILRRQLDEVRTLLRGMEATSRTKMERHEEAKGMERDITALLDQHRLRLLELGTAGRLLLAGEIDEVLPLDDADLLDQAKPVTPHGKVRFNSERLSARHDGQVQAMLDGGGKVSLVVLGGSHDLSESVRRRGSGSCEYLRITTKRFQQFTGEK